MPLLVFEDSHKEHLSFLSDFDPDVVKEFGKICLSFINKGTNPKVFQSAAQKLGVPSDSVQHAVEGLMFLLTESSKLLLNDIDFQDSLLSLALKEETRLVLFEIYTTHRKEVRGILGEMGVQLPHYHNLHWRLDVQLASRSLRHQITPRVLMRLDLQDGCSNDDDMEVDGSRPTSSTLLETDLVNLNHMSKVLEEALAEMKSGYCRRITRNIK